MHGLAVYVKELFPFTWYLYLWNSTDSYLRFWLDTPLGVLLHFLNHCLCTVFDAISSNINGVLSINPSANVFVFGNFNVQHSGGTDRPGKVCYNFLPQMILLTWSLFLLESMSVNCTALLFWISFFLLKLVFALQWLCLHLEILILYLSQFPLTFYQTQNLMPHFIA